MHVYTRLRALALLAAASVVAACVGTEAKEDGSSSCSIGEDCKLVGTLKILRGVRSLPRCSLSVRLNSTPALTLAPTLPPTVAETPASHERKPDADRARKRYVPSERRWRIPITSWIWCTDA